jgi:hypothetical protein
MAPVASDHDRRVRRLRRLALPAAEALVDAGPSLRRVAAARLACVDSARFETVDRGSF